MWGEPAFWSEDDGATAIEYGLIASLICIAILGAVYALSEASTEMWTELANHVASST